MGQISFPAATQRDTTQGTTTRQPARWPLHVGGESPGAVQGCVGIMEGTGEEPIGGYRGVLAGSCGARPCVCLDSCYCPCLLVWDNIVLVC